MGEDYYKTLGVSRDASDAEIQKAYRKLARQYHPDLHPDDAAAKEKFQKIQSAYEVLSDPEKREMFNRYGSDFEQMGGSPFGGGDMDIDISQIFGGAGGGPFGDIFRQFGGAGGGGRGQRQRRPSGGSDLKQEITVPFNVAAGGGEARINVQRSNGKSESLTVKIPAGIESGKKIRLRGQGNPGRGGRDGDLIVTVNISSHPFFTRRGDTLELKVPITVLEAIEGAKVDIPTPKGTVTVQIPPGSSSGKKLRLKGCGIQFSDKPAGELLAEVQIMLPGSLNADDIDVLRNISGLQMDNPRGDLRW